MNPPEDQQTAELLHARISELETENARLKAALSDRGELSGILSICAACKRIRDDDQWLAPESFFESRLDVEFSHSLCDACEPRFGFSDDDAAG